MKVVRPTESYTTSTPPPSGEAPGLDLEILLGVENDFIGPGRARQCCLVFGGNSPDDPRSTEMRDLAEKQSDSTRGGMDQTGVASREREGRACQIVSRHALEHRSGGDSGRNPLRQDHQPVGPSQGELGVGSGEALRGHSIAHLDLGDARSNLDDAARRFRARV